MPAVARSKLRSSVSAWLDVTITDADYADDIALLVNTHLTKPNWL